MIHPLLCHFLRSVNLPSTLSDPEKVTLLYITWIFTIIISICVIVYGLNEIIKLKEKLKTIREGKGRKEQKEADEKIAKTPLGFLYRLTITGVCFIVFTTGILFWVLFHS